MRRSASSQGTIHSHQSEEKSSLDLRARANLSDEITKQVLRSAAGTAPTDRICVQGARSGLTEAASDS